MGFVYLPTFRYEFNKSISSLIIDLEDRIVVGWPVSEGMIPKTLFMKCLVICTDMINYK